MSTLRQKLKQHTDQAHTTLESLYPLKDVQFQPTKTAYTDNLNLLYHWHKFIEKTFEKFFGHSEFQGYQLNVISVALSKELTSLGTDTLLSDEVVPTGNINSKKFSESDYFMGWLYVILGSSMGAQVLHRQLSKHAFYQEIATSYYEIMAGYNTRWLGYLEHLNTLDNIETDLLLQGAEDAFALLLDFQEQLFGAA